MSVFYTFDFYIHILNSQKIVSIKNPFPFRWNRFEILTIYFALSFSLHNMIGYLVLCNLKKIHKNLEKYKDMKKIDYTKIAIICLKVNIFLSVVIAFESIYKWNIFEAFLQSFMYAIAISYFCFFILVCLIAFLDEINGIKKALTKISDKL
jgi:hypothetical protein